MFTKQGFDLVPQPASSWKVHERAYTQRKNNPLETIIDIQSEAFIQRVIPVGVERLHFTMQPQQIAVRPVFAPLFHIRRALQHSDPFNCFLALSSGLDAFSFTDVGFRIQAVLDWRPPEARDTQDLTETGLCTFLANHQPELVFNEDITTVEPGRISEQLQQCGPIAVLSIGLQCDDFSTAKSARLKRQEIAEFRPSSRELGYYAMKLIEGIRPASVLIENVPGWHGSESQGVLGAVLTRLGYHVQAVVLNARDFGALTSRSRCYLVASCWPGFLFPTPTHCNAQPLGAILQTEIPKFKDLTHTKTVQSATTSGRARFCALTAPHAPTVMKSQARHTKDSLFFTQGSRVLLPTVQALKTLHGFGPELKLNAVSAEIAVEQIGQGIDKPLHTAVVRQLHTHLRQNTVRSVWQR